MKKTKCIFIIFIILFFLQNILGITSFAVENTASNNLKNINVTNDTQSDSSNPAPITTNSPSCVLIESSTGKILYEKEANKIRYPASTTKIMTAILVLENCKLTDVATVSHNAIYSIPADYVTANIYEGEKLTVEQLLNVLLIPSANDVAVVLAEHVSGSVNKFADLMNKKAKEIGCKNTHFVNPNGIHNKDHVSTAYDLALIGQYAMKNNTFREIVQKTKYTLPATNKYKKADRTFTNTNKLLLKGDSNAKDNYYYPNTTGIKTGYTDDAGSCLVSSAKKDNMELISVILGAGFTKDGLSEKFTDSINLFEYAFKNYSLKTVHEKDSVLQDVKVPGATKETKNLSILVKDNIAIFCKNSEALDDLQPEITLNKLKAPISAGETVGKITYTIDGKTYSSDLIAKADVIPSKFLPILLRIILIIVTLSLIYLLLRSGKNTKDVNRSTETKSYKSKKSTKGGKKGGRYRYTSMSNL